MKLRASRWRASSRAPSRRLATTCESIRSQAPSSSASSRTCGPQNGKQEMRSILGATCAAVAAADGTGETVRELVRKSAAPQTILMKRSAMLKVSNEAISECFVQESPLASELDSGARVTPRPIAGNQPNRMNAAGLVRGGLPPRVLRRVREHIDANIEQRISVEALAKLANLSVW